MLNKLWYQNHPLRWFLLPFSGLFWIISSLRRWCFKVGLKKQTHPGVPVLVIGNISVGGNGKTPMVIAAVKCLMEAGYQPGILSRGYGGKCAVFPHVVSHSDEPEWVGDEPRLMASRLDCPVIIDPKRPRGANKLVDLGCNVIVCDDGMQHYPLLRDIEWVVMDDRGVGNGCLLPMGPLRELPQRLQSVDAVIHNGKNPYWPHAFKVKLTPTKFINVVDKARQLTSKEFTDKYKNGVSALAGIGDPSRFFNTLVSLDITLLKTTSLIDHHAFSAKDIPAEPTVMTEKDAVKCVDFAHKDCWYLEVEVDLPDDLQQHLLDKLVHIASNIGIKSHQNRESHGI